MSHKSEIEQVIEQCKQDCGDKAVAMGFSANAGYDIYEGCVNDDLQKWTEDRFYDWVLEIQMLYGKTSRAGEALIDLYNACNEIMGQYGNQLTK
jgi:hypothetical protein